MSDPFGTVRLLASRRDEADWAWRCEVLNLRAAGFSLRAIADAAGVSHDTVWKMR
jgi:lambda repressor-like predicted transcriptional regulator